MATIEDLQNMLGRGQEPNNTADTEPTEVSQGEPAPAGGDVMAHAGIEAFLNTSLANIVVSLEELLPLVGSTSEKGKASDKCIKALSKVVPDDIINKVRSAKQEMTAQFLTGGLGQ